jgi:diguanylate cyclase (GGDEF)-like protein
MTDLSFRRPYWLLAVLGWCLASCAWAGIDGEPLLQRFTPADFKATPYLFSVAIDPDGRVYVGNNDGLLRMQGHEWQTLELPEGMGANELQRGRDQRIYLAGYDSFGVINTAADGSMVYRDLRDAFGLRGNQRALGWFWQILPVSDGMYFYSENQLLLFRFKGKPQRWPIAKGSVQAGFATWHDRIYTQNKERGLLRFDDGQWLPVTNGDLLKSHTGALMIDQGDSALIVTNGGFYRLRGDAVTALNVPPLPTVPFSLMQVLNDGSFVVGTNGGELLHYDAGAHLLAQMPIAHSSITGLDVDGEGDLWTTTEDELIRLQVGSPWSRLDVGSLGGVVSDCEWHDGSLWLAVGSRGLAKLSESGGQTQVSWIADEAKLQVFSLISTETGLLVGNNNGIDEVDSGDKVRHVLHDELQPVFAIARSHFDADVAYATGQAGVYLLRRQLGHWNLIKSFPAPELASQTLDEIAPGVLWVNNARGLPERWTLDLAHSSLLKRERFPIRAGAVRIDLTSGTTQLMSFGQKVFVQVGRQALRFDGQAFVPFDGPPFSFMQRPNSFAVIDTPVGAFAYTGSLLYHQQADGSWKQIDFGNEPAASQSVLRYGSDGILRLSIWRALLQYRPQTHSPPSLPPLQTRLTAATLIDAQGREQALPVQSGEPVEFSQDHDIQLHFSVFTPEPGIEYRSRIPGLYENFDDWSDTPSLTLSGLEHPGTFRVEIQARAPSGRRIQPLRFAFTVLPRWYQRTVVQLLFVLAALLGLRALQSWRERRREQVYIQRQQDLERKIAERTEALAEANRKLEELATEDSLTGVDNRRALELGLQREWRRCLDQRLSIALLMIDVDQFKQYNDQHGHLAGDVVLKGVADRLAIGLEPQRELLARYGGEEFCLLLPGIQLEAAKRRAESLRQSFETGDSPVTVSIGVAACVPCESDTPEALLRAADTVLYEAKRRGRNRVEVANSL